ncbi:hypothetical protein [Leeuwenhoekiella sp. W20_SRS_FM14]
MAKKEGLPNAPSKTGKPSGKKRSNKTTEKPEVSESKRKKK